MSPLEPHQEQGEGIHGRDEGQESIRGLLADWREFGVRGNAAGTDFNKHFNLQSDVVIYQHKMSKTNVKFQ